MSCRRSSRAQSSLDDEDLLPEILLRLPPKPSSLPRASLVCRRWRSILSDPRFIRRFRKHHRKPPLLGFFSRELGAAPFFTPMLNPPDRIPVANFALPENLVGWEPWAILHPDLAFSFHGCRDGIALFLDHKRREAVLRDPLTGVQCWVDFPPGFDNYTWSSVGEENYIWSAAVLCSAGDEQHMHGDGHLRPFRLVFVCHDPIVTKVSVCIYESMSGVWGDIISTATTQAISRRPSILVGNALCWLFEGGDILKVDFKRPAHAVIQKPADAHDVGDFGADWSFQILWGEDNGLGLAIFSVPTLNIQLWARKYNSDGVISWVLQKTVQLDELTSQPVRYGKVFLMPGYDEDTNVIFLSSDSHDFVLQLESMQFNYIGRREYMSARKYYPYTNLCTAGRGIAGGDGVAENV